MKSLTCCQASRTRVEMRTSEKGLSWTWHGIAHCLSSQQDQSGSEDMTVRRDPAEPGMTSLTCCQANRTRVRVRTMRRDPAGTGMKLLTSCQANRIRVGVRTVRRYPAGPGMKLLTCKLLTASYQANRTKVEVRCNGSVFFFYLICD